MAWKPPDRDTFGWRLDAALRDAGLTQRELARRLGIHPSRVSEYVHNHALPPVTRMVRMCEELDVSIHWLLTGRGKRHVEEPAIDERALHILQVLRRLLQELPEDLLEPEADEGSDE